MQAAILMGIYVLTTIAVQLIGFSISQIVAVEWPTAAVMTVLVLFLGAFGLAWPIAVRIAEWLIQKAGFELETEQSAGASHRAHYTKKA